MAFLNKSSDFGPVSSERGRSADSDFFFFLFNCLAVGRLGDLSVLRLVPLFLLVFQLRVLPRSCRVRGLVFLSVKGSFDLFASGSTESNV